MSAGVALICGAALLHLAVPRTVAAFLMLPGSETIWQVRHGGGVAPEDLERAIAAQRRGLAWIDSGRVWSDLGLAELLLATKGGGTEAAADLRTSLRRAPANPHAWARLAYAEMARDGPSPTAARALTLSILTARYEPDLMPARLELALAAWPYFAVEDRDLVLDQIRLAWARTPARVVELARRSGRADAARAALARRPAALAEFERRLAAGG